ncbi:M20/M25/M40 family metallo-hydrolase [Kordiimonas sp.]|uniref:M20/M25/M40 family metallo-hydrolase n=1 Tax=Kordiimonas sp. TaxID=1970157 RepID=UPI003A948BBC
MRILKLLGLTLLVLITVMVTRTFVMLPAGEARTLRSAEIDPVEARRIGENLAAAIRFPTISHSFEEAPDDEAFKGFHAFLETTYPNVHRVMEKEVVSDYSLMYRWPAGVESSKKPIALLAHMDVVPIPEYGLKDWKYPPFDGVIDEDGVLWGRGALDDKGILISLMEAAERLAIAGFTPDRDIYFLFGHDEELGGDLGAIKMAERLAAKGVQLAWAMDEGSAMTDGIVPGIKSPVALVSLGEKGSVTLRFSAEDEGGHSSAPKEFTAASLAAKAGVAVMDNPYDPVLDEHLEEFLFAVAPEQPFINRMMIANLWLTRPLLEVELSKSPTVAAFMRTTTAFTMMKSGTKTNILPQYGEAVVNYRIHPRDTVESVTERARSLVDDERVTITNLGGGREATSMSDALGEGYKTIEATIRDEFSDIPIAPTLTVQGTDARHYDAVADGVYRFMPFVFKPEDLKRIHGTNEAVPITVIARQVDFFEKLMRRSAGE